MKKFFIFTILFSLSFSFLHAEITKTQRADQKFIIKINEQIFGPYTFATKPYLAKGDSSHWVFIYSKQGKPVHYSWVHVKDRPVFVKTWKREIGPYDQVWWRSVDFTSIDKLCYFVAARGKKRFIVMDGQEYGPYSEVKANFYFYNNEKIWAVRVITNAGYYDGHMIGGKQKICVNGKLYGEFRFIHSWDILNDFKTLKIDGQKKGEDRKIHYFKLE